MNRLSNEPTTGVWCKVFVSLHYVMSSHILVCDRMKSGVYMETRDYSLYAFGGGTLHCANIHVFSTSRQLSKGPK